MTQSLINIHYNASLDNSCYGIVELNLEYFYLRKFMNNVAKLFSLSLIVIVVVFAFIPRSVPPTRASLVLMDQVENFTTIPDTIFSGTRWERAQKFKNFLTPIIKAENSKILYSRAYLLDLIDISETIPLTDTEQHWLSQTSEFYKISKFNYTDPHKVSELLNRMDIIPTPIVLSQAAIESNWGNSGFAKRGNNLFGMRTTSRTKGMVPKKRATGATFRVASYTTINSSVRYYIRNLNTHSAYQKMRDMRTEMRTDDQPLDAYTLATGLTPYSSLGHDYVKIIHTTMNTYSSIFGE